MTIPSARRPAKQAGEDLLVLSRFEAFTAWLFDRTAAWPKNARFTLTQRIENHALDVLEDLTVARYSRDGRRARLDRVNLLLERSRRLFRIALGTRRCPAAVFEHAMREIDEAGRMVYAWRSKIQDSAPL